MESREQHDTALLGDFALAFQRASETLGVVRRDLLIAGRVVSLEFAGSALLPLVMPAFAHLEYKTASTAMPALTVKLWDTASTHIPPPPAPPATAGYLPHRELGQASANGNRLWFSMGSGVLQCYAPHLQHAFCWVRDATTIPNGEVAAPLRTTLGAWAENWGGQLVHGAAIGIPDGGVLLVGRGGSGKSTTALHALAAGWSFAGDDSALVSFEGNCYQARSLYSSARVAATRLASDFAQLSPTEVGCGGDGKTLVFLSGSARTLATSIPLNALIAPRVSPIGLTTLRRAPAADLLKALAPSSLFLVPGAGQAVFSQLAAMVRAIPGYTLELGLDASANLAAIAEVIVRHAGSLTQAREGAKR